MKNGTVRHVKATGILKQRLIVTFSRKMMEYQRTVRNQNREILNQVRETAFRDFNAILKELDRDLVVVGALSTEHFLDILRVTVRTAR